MEDCNPQHRPYVLWFDTLPDGQTAKVYIWPRKGQPGAILHLNERLHRIYPFETNEQAIAKAWALHEQLVDEAIGQRTQ